MRSYSGPHFPAFGLTLHSVDPKLDFGSQQTFKRNFQKNLMYVYVYIYDVVLVFLLLTLYIFYTASTVSIVDFEKVNAGWIIL